MGVGLSRRAAKDLRGLGSHSDLDRIEKRFGEIEDAASVGELPPSTKLLSGTTYRTWRTRAGDYRILWVADDEEVLIVRVIHRSDLDQVVASL